MSRTGERSSPSGVALPKAGNALRFRLRLTTVRQIREIRRPNFGERRSGPRSGLRGSQRLHIYTKGVFRRPALGGRFLPNLENVPTIQDSNLLLSQAPS